MSAPDWRCLLQAVRIIREQALACDAGSEQQRALAVAACGVERVGVELQGAYVAARLGGIDHGRIVRDVHGL